jgi:hypothetical protein
MSNRTYTRFSKEEIASWPPEHKKCRGCQEVLPFTDFGNHKGALFDLANECKECRKPKSKADYASKSHEQLLFEWARSRAKKKGLEFTITVDDIVIPERCPVFDYPLIRMPGHKMGPIHTATLDRIDSTKGYIPGNVQVISEKANRIKSDATPFEIDQLWRWIFGYQDFCVSIKTREEAFPNNPYPFGP